MENCQFYHYESLVGFTPGVNFIDIVKWEAFMALLANNIEHKV